MRTLRALLTFKLGFIAGVAAAAALVKRAVPSRGDEDDPEAPVLSLAGTAVFGGIAVKAAG